MGSQISDTNKGLFGCHFIGIKKKVNTYVNVQWVPLVKKLTYLFLQSLFEKYLSDLFTQKWSPTASLHFLHGWLIYNTKKTPKPNAFKNDSQILRAETTQTIQTLLIACWLGTVTFWSDLLPGTLIVDPSSELQLQRLLQFGSKFGKKVCRECTGMQALPPWSQLLS